MPFSNVTLNGTKIFGSRLPSCFGDESEWEAVTAKNFHSLMTGGIYINWRIFILNLGNVLICDFAVMCSYIATKLMHYN